jgi:hypothetical protein
MPKLVVVDGSNIATEGRAMPSLQQLHEAVMAFREENPEALVTVVVDATFGHRIEPAEVPDFDAAVEHNELVTPPAGAVGRGDAFVLTIANKANATILSNDSFQEFHGAYPWLFDDGRLIGGKPVPHVGWVFVPRTPVRGPTSRKSVRTAKLGTPVVKKRRAAGDGAVAEKAAASPKRRAATTRPVVADVVDGRVPHPAQGAEAPTPGRQQMVNELLPFLSFVEEHPVGSPVEGVADAYSSHGAYVLVGETRCYVPLRYLGSPAPRSAREVLKLGATAIFTVASFNPARRSIDLALAGFEPPGLVAAPAPAAKRGRKRAASPEVSAVVPGPAPAATDSADAAPVKRIRKKATKATPVKGTPVKGTAVKGTPVKGTAKATPVKATPAKGASAKGTPAKSTPAKGSTRKAAAAKATSVKPVATKAKPDVAPPAPTTRSRKSVAGAAPAPATASGTAAAPPKRSRAKAPASG